MIHPDLYTALLYMSGTLLVVTAAVVTANIIDFVSAVITARQLHIDIQSAKMRHALEKMFRYLLLVAMFFLFDGLIAMTALTHIPWCAIVIGVVILLVEGKSVLEHYVRRRDKIAKIPESLHELVSWIGEDKAKAMLEQALRAAVRHSTGVVFNPFSPEQNQDDSPV